MYRKTLLLGALFGVICTASPVPAATGAEAAAEAQTRYLVRFRAERAGRARDLLHQHPQRVRRELQRHRAVAMDLSASEASALAADPAVEMVEADPPRHPVSMMRARPSGADQPADTDGRIAQVVPYGVQLVQALGYRGNRRAVKVCVIDSGYDMGHEDKPAHQRVTGSDDPGGTGRWTRDGDGHGTHVSGTINARDNDVGILGVFPGVSMHIVRVFGNRGTWTYSSDLVAALDECLAAGARVVNMSLGGGDPSSVENAAFKAAFDDGVLLIAAAGNGGREGLSYPAAYGSVISVAAVDADARQAAFSTRNGRVMLAAPGVSVLSTVPRGTVIDVLLGTTLGGIEVVPMDNFPIPDALVGGDLVDCGLAETAAACGDASAAICLIERGEFTFAQKAQSCQAAGGVAAVVFNQPNASGPVYGTLGSTRVAIPVVGTERAIGLQLREGQLGTRATLAFSPSLYDYDWYSGTSMATPHVSGVAALIWSTHPLCSNRDIRRAMNVTAIDLGEPGRDHRYGFGLVQARAASDFLDQIGCNGG